MAKRMRDKEWDTFSVRTLTRQATAYRREHQGQNAPAVDLAPLPTRNVCRDGPRPCPHVRCRYNLLVEVGDKGTVRVYWNGTDETPDTCSLDVAERGAKTLDEVAKILRLTPERVRQVESKALDNLRTRLESQGLCEEQVQEALEKIALPQHRVSASFGDPVDTPKDTYKMALAARACLEELDRKAGRRIDVNPFVKFQRLVKPDA